MEQLLTTKLFIPATRLELVARQRLVKRLNQGISGTLNLISAPAGFGKTTLLSEWVEDLRQGAKTKKQSQYHIAWLSLDENDNQLNTFLAYFITALYKVDGLEKVIGEEALGMLESPQPPPAESILISLINDLTGISGRIILVLDDYHVIESSEVDEAVSFLLENHPSQLHLVIATRSDPQLSLGRLRVQGQLAELRAADLRFTSEEAAEFLNQVMGLNLSAGDINALENRTEGWIAGLQMAAISMRGVEDTKALIKSFTGSHRFVLDYLIEEVLEQQPEEIQNFLMQTSILSRLTGPLCGLLTGQKNGQQTLEMLENANLFIVPLDEERQWYRYHHLFSELLQQRLRITNPDLIKKLHTKAVNWFEDNQYLSEALPHAFAGEDIEAAIRLTEKGALKSLERSEFGFIFNAVNKLPDSALEKYPWLFVYYAWALILTGQLDAIGTRLDNTDWLLASLPDDDESQKQKMRGYIAGLKANQTAWQRDYAKMREYAQQALDSLPQNHWIRGYCLMMIGISCWEKGDLSAAKEAFSEAAQVGRASGNKRVAVTSATYLGHSLELEGHPQRALNLYQDSFQFTEQNGRQMPLSAYLHIDSGRALYELNELELASQHLSEGINLALQLSDTRIEQLAHNLLARVHMANQDLESAAGEVEDGQQAHPAPHGIVLDMRGTEYPEVRLWIKQNNLRELEAWLKKVGTDPEVSPDFKTRLTFAMQARAMIALGRAQPDSHYLDDALHLLDRLLEMAANNGWRSRHVEILALQAMAWQAKGDVEKALSILNQALTLAELEGFIRTIVDEGPPMEALLRKVKPKDERMKVYIQKLLAVFAEKAVALSPTKSQPLIEPLSERELEVLALMAKGLTNADVADQLFLSQHTVKVHTRNIYGKLGVHNRTQAAARAQELALLSLD